MSELPSHRWLTASPFAWIGAWHTLAAMFTLAPTLGLLFITLPSSPTFERTPVIALCISGYFAALFPLTWRDRLSAAHVAGLLVYASLAITAADRVSGSAASPFTSFQFWPMLTGALFLPAAHLVALGGVTVVGAGHAILHADLTGDGPLRLAVLNSSLGVAVVIMRRAAWRVRTELDQLVERARTDPLTGLQNRQAFDEVLERETRLAARGHVRFALALLDVDHFKSINDTRGHAAGDEVLRALGVALRARLRTTDDAFRIGGDELAVILRGCSGEDAAGVIREAAELFAGLAPGVSVSVGVAEVPGCGARCDTIFAAADAALYRAKASGRATICVAPSAREGLRLV